MSEPWPPAPHLGDRHGLPFKDGFQELERSASARRLVWPAHDGFLGTAGQPLFGSLARFGANPTGSIETSVDPEPTHPPPPVHSQRETDSRNPHHARKIEPTLARPRS